MYWYVRKESIIAIQSKQGHPNPWVHYSSGKLGKPLFPTGMVNPRVEAFLSTLMDSIYVIHVTTNHNNLASVKDRKSLNLNKKKISWIIPGL